MNELEIKRKRIETFGKVIGLGVVGFFFAPLAYATITGLVSLVTVGVIGLLVVNVGVPWFSVSLANWRLKALKATAIANPIETLENDYKKKQENLAQSRENIKASYAILETLYSQIQEHANKYPNRPSQYLDKYNKLKSLIELRGNKYKQAQSNLVKYSELIEEKRSDWNIAKTMAQASELANVGEEFQSKLLQDTALSTIQTGLNVAFSELETSLLDEDNKKTNDNTVTVVEISPSTNNTNTNKTYSKPSFLPEKCNVLDLGFDAGNIDDRELVGATNIRKKAKVSFR